MLPIVTPAPRRARHNRPGLSIGRSRTKSLSVSFFNHEKSYLVFNLLFIPTTTTQQQQHHCSEPLLLLLLRESIHRTGFMFSVPTPHRYHRSTRRRRQRFDAFCAVLQKNTFQLRTHYRQIGSASPECPCYQVRITSTHRESAIDMASVSVMISFVSDFLFSVFFSLFRLLVVCFCTKYVSAPHIPIVNANGTERRP